MMHRAYLAVVVATLLPPNACYSRAPVIGGPCEGCELVYEGLPDPIESRERIAPPDEAGEPLVIEGVVRTADGAPATNVIVYAYHTDAGGLYPPSDTRHGRLRGWVHTDDAGRYRFDTIRPGAYPTRDNPQHVHMHIIEPQKATYTIDDLIFDDDPLLSQEHRRRMRRGRGGDGLTHPRRDAEGVWRVRRDITLGENIPGYER